MNKKQTIIAVFLVPTLILGGWIFTNWQLNRDREIEYHRVQFEGVNVTFRKPMDCHSVYSYKTNSTEPYSHRFECDSNLIDELVIIENNEQDRDSIVTETCFNYCFRGTNITIDDMFGSGDEEQNKCFVECTLPMFS